ncbi:uncharacterized protein LOC123499746 isoform X4 [Portunus trituberculatus]|uniref:uncharacterized protein LOC123499746 isoform X4 n=1 Tax=Portunus trituberculatus TaxID=210409 RepID=UPI001E1CFDBF|nr:uncharacterized protein LOC123499746 isoform X4 [Portunus trituberculatus]
MAEWRAVNIATITEEKVEEEEVGEDGMVETIISPMKKQPPEAESPQPAASAAHTNDGKESRPSPERQSSLVEKEVEEGQDNRQAGDGEENRRPSLERPSSLVEKEVEEGEDSKQAISTILSTISFDSDSSSVAPARTTLPRTHPAAPRNAAPRHAAARSRTLPRTGSRASGFTMNLSEKFVTELSLYDPDGSREPLLSPVILLGLFLATDQVLGDHSIYKVSPVSPLAALKIRPQDRLLKINGVSLEGWSHACVVDYVKSLTLSAAATATAEDPDTPTDIRLSIELRRSGRNVRSPQETPTSKILDATLRIRRRRATVTAVQEREMCVRYRTTVPRCLKEAQKGLYLSINLSSSGVAGLVACADNSDGAGRFLLHTFDVSSISSSSPHLNGRSGGGGGGGGIGGGGVGQGEVVVMESDACRSWYLHASTPDCVALMFASGLEPQTLTEKDVRFFSLVPLPGDDHLFRIQNLSTGSFLSVAPDCLSLVARDVYGSLPDSTVFHVLNC